MADASHDVITRQVSTTMGRLHVTGQSGPGLRPLPQPDLATDLVSLFPRAGTRLVDGASRWPQWDQPDAVAELIR